MSLSQTDSNDIRAQTPCRTPEPSESPKSENTEAHTPKSNKSPTQNDPVYTSSPAKGKPQAEFTTTKETRKKRARQHRVDMHQRFITMNPQDFMDTFLPQVDENKGQVKPEQQTEQQSNPGQQNEQQSNSGKQNEQQINPERTNPEHQSNPKQRSKSRASPFKSLNTTKTEKELQASFVSISTLIYNSTSC